MPPQPILRRALYAAVRRAGVIDVTRLLHLPTAALRPVPPPPTYQLRRLQAAELRDLLTQRQAPAEIGRPEALDDDRHRLIVASQGDQVVSYVWLTRDQVAAADNFSRAPHLGTPLRLSRGWAFVHTAMTLPQHRGRHLLPALLSWAMQAGVGGTERLLTTVDWTNRPSRAAFARVGFAPLGLLWRLGRGSLQLTLAPAATEPLGIQLGPHLPGLLLNLPS